jgi:SAM-dependent methyltransferase
MLSPCHGPGIRPTLYRGSARYYLEGRLPYAPGLADAFARELGLDGRGRLIDIGCGPGIVALELAALFEEVVGVDADPDMIAEALREARRRGVGSGQWLTMRAEELPGELGQFRVATLAQSFHWMERERVAEAIHGMLEPEGALVHVNAFTRRGVEASLSTHPEPPWEAISALVRRYLGSETLAGQGRRDAVFVDIDDIFGRSFRGPNVVRVPDGRVFERTADQVVAAVFSVSSSAPHLFADRLHRFESDLRGVLKEASAEGRFAQQTGDTELRIWRLPS